MTEPRTLGPGGLLTVRRVLELVPIGRSTLYDLIKSGQLPHYRMSAAGSSQGRILIARADLEAFIEKSRAGGVA